MGLEQFFKENPKVAVAFSGGVDSAYLLYAAAKYARQVKAYYAKTVFQPQFELDDAIKLAEELRVQMDILSVDILCKPEITENPADRCYHCKRALFSAIIEAAGKDGFHTLLDGTNASDEVSDRPGMRALQEMAVRSPLRESGLTKAEIRGLSKEAGLFTWNKPAYACLATRIPTGQPITQEQLHRTELAETALFQLGLRDFRVRTQGNAAKLQVTESDLITVLGNREDILAELKKYYDSVTLDLEVRK